MSAEAVNSVQGLFFSPTGSTRKIVETIARGTGLPEIAPVSITTPQERDSFSGRLEGDLVIVGVPVYAGRFPALILPPLGRMDGTGRWALPVAVCGNVRMGSCLAELCAVLKRQGFTIPAAGNFVAQHTFACEHFAMGAGRPDEEDLRQAAAALMKKLKCRCLLITRGNKGMALYQRRKKRPLLLPIAKDHEAVDVTGAGDTVVAAFTLALGAQAPPEDAARIANHAAGVAVLRSGAVAVTANEIIQSISN